MDVESPRKRLQSRLLFSSLRVWSFGNIPELKYTEQLRVIVEFIPFGIVFHSFCSGKHHQRITRNKGIGSINDFFFLVGVFATPTLFGLSVAHLR